MINGTLVNLRAREMSDVERNARWINDPEVARPLGEPYLKSVAAMESALREQTRSVPPAGDVWLAIETKDGRHIGNLRLLDVAPEDRAARVAIHIGDPDFRDKGYGTDAMKTLVRFAFEEMNLNRIELGVFDYNERAIASYRKCGFVEEARRRQAHYERGSYHDAVIMSVLRSEWGG
jgi:RimJ/RimL family protein N-acetyltransferase